MIISQDGIYDFLNLLTNSIVSDCPKKTDLQQNLSNPSSSRIFFDFSPSDTRFLYCSHKWPIGLPHEKHLIGIIMWMKNPEGF